MSLLLKVYVVVVCSSRLFCTVSTNGAKPKDYRANVFEFLCYFKQKSLAKKSELMEKLSPELLSELSFG